LPKLEITPPVTKIYFDIVKHSLKKRLEPKLVSKRHCLDYSVLA